jgi:peptidoglycan/xylan/chitin deacetylase (PgdA/CDA1 family)
MEDYLFEVTGIRPMLTRFPGGSRGSYSNRSMDVMEGLRGDMDRLGYIYVDWNVLGGDVSSDDPDFFVSEVLRQVQGKTNATVLFHDTAANREILQAIPLIVEELRAQGYHFAALDPKEYFVRY